MNFHSRHAARQNVNHFHRCESRPSARWAPAEGVPLGTPSKKWHGRPRPPITGPTEQLHHVEPDVNSRGDGGSGPTRRRHRLGRSSDAQEQPLRVPSLRPLHLGGPRCLHAPGPALLLHEAPCTGVYGHRISTAAPHLAEPSALSKQQGLPRHGHRVAVRRVASL